MHEGLALGGAEQVRPQVPQLELSLARLTQEPLQFVVPAVQLTRHVPAEHVCAGPQTVVHVPQCWRSDARLMQRPPHGVYPGLHAMPHWPAAHVAEPFAGGGQTLLHAPQWRVSLSTRRHDEPHGSKPL